MEILKGANRMMNAPAGCYFPSLWLLQSLFSSYILRRLFSPETLVSHHKIIQFYCVGGGWNLATLGSNTGADLGECILRVVWMSLVQNQSLLSRQKTVMLTVISVGFKFRGEVGELLNYHICFPGWRPPSWSPVSTEHYTTCARPVESSVNTLVCQRTRNSWGPFNSSSMKFSGWHTPKG